MRFEELILQSPEGDLRVRFHARLTLLAGLDPGERAEFTDATVAALVGGSHSILHYRDGSGKPIELVAEGGPARGRRADPADDGPAPDALGLDRAALQALLVVDAEDLREPVQPSTTPESAELIEARATLAELEAAVEVAAEEQQGALGRRAELDAVLAELQSAKDNAARRQHAGLRAQLERVRAEAAALDTSEQDVARDRDLISQAASLRNLVERWAEAVANRNEAESPDDLASTEEGEADDSELITVPADLPEDIANLIDGLAAANTTVASIEHRLQDLAVARLPTPSDPRVAELGLLDQRALWAAAQRLQSAEEALRQLQLSLGGLELSDLGPPPAQIDGIERAHSDVEAAEHSVEASRKIGLAGSAVGLLVAASGLLINPILGVIGLIGAAVSGGVGLLLPRLRLARASRVEVAALAEAGADSYLGFHLRRVEASIDPLRRGVVAAAVAEHEQALQAWRAMAGDDADLDAIQALTAEIEAYHAALQELGDTAEEMEQLRQQLHNEARPERSAARNALATACEPYMVLEEQLDDPQLATLLKHQCRRGQRARRQEARREARVACEQLSHELGATLTDLGLDRDRVGVDAGDPAATAAAIEQMLDDAAARDRSRQQARPQDEIAAEIEHLDAQAKALERPEWKDLPPLDGEPPDVSALEARRVSLEAAMASHTEDPAAERRRQAERERLVERRAAAARRVAALEAQGTDERADPFNASGVQQRILDRLAAAAEAGPDGDPVPLLLDEALTHVPVDRRWDLLDLLLRLSEEHQLIYLTGDPFVAAWGHRQVVGGDIALWEPSA